MTAPSLLARLSALRAADQREFRERSVPEGCDVCHECDGIFEEGDLLYDHNGDNPRCLDCIARMHGLVKERRRRAGAVLVAEGKEPWEL